MLFFLSVFLIFSFSYLAYFILFFGISSFFYGSKFRKFLHERMRRK